MPEFSTPEAPIGGDFGNASFEQVMHAVTGHGPDLHAFTVRGAGGSGDWITMSGTKPGSAQKDGEGGGTLYSYHAWDVWYIALDRNDGKLNDWERYNTGISDNMDELANGKLGLMDAPRLRVAQGLLQNYVNWLRANRDTVQTWVGRLTSDDSAYKGKAAHAIKENLESIAFTMNDLYTQLMNDRNPDAPTSLARAATALDVFGDSMANTWWDNSAALYGAARNAVNAIQGNIRAYVHGKGLAHGTDNYALDALASNGGVEAGKRHIKLMIDNYKSTDNVIPYKIYPIATFGGMGYVMQTGTDTFEPGPLPTDFPALSGPLDQQSTIDSFNNAINTYLRTMLGKIDTPARTHLSLLQTAYDNTRKPLDELYAPTPPTPGGSGNTPPPFGNIPPPALGGDIPPPAGGGDIPPPAGGGDIPPPAGGGDIPPPAGGGDIPPLAGGGDIPPPAGLGDIPPPAGGGDIPPPAGLGDISPPAGFGSDLPPAGSGFDPSDPNSFLPPANGGGNFPPGGNLPGGFIPPPAMLGPNPANGGSGGLVDRNGRPITLPDTDSWNPPALGGAGGLPTGGDPFDPASFPAGGGSAMPAGGSDTAGGFGDVPAGAGGADGASSFGGTSSVGGGEGWSDWSGQDQSDQPDTSGRALPDTGPMGSGMPMMPPMMPPNGGQNGSKERERQTWLSEDDKVWGTATGVGNGVIGLPQDLATETEEQAAPIHVHMRARTPDRTSLPTKARQAKGQTTGQTT
jgi:hypothetical protein